MLLVFKRISWFLKQKRKSYISLMLLLCLISFLTVLTPRIVGEFIDLIAMGKLTTDLFYKMMILLIGLPMVIFGLNYIFHKNLNYNGQILSRQLRILYLGKLFNHDAKIFEEYSKGELVSRLSNDMPSITTVATSVMTDLVYCISLLAFLLFIMIFTISLKLTIVAFVIIPVTFVLLNIARQRMRKYYHIHRKIYAKFYDSTLESIEGSRVVRAYAQEDKDIKKNKQAVNEDIDSWKKIVRFENIFVPLFDSVISVSIFLTYFYGAYLVITSQITPGELVTFSMYITMVSGPIMVLANSYNFISQAAIGSERYFEVMDKVPEVEDNQQSLDIVDFHKLVYQNVSFKYPFDEMATIKNIDMSIYAGETIGIVGPTGSGKSTLIRQILREFKVTSGDILLNDKPVQTYKLKSIRNLLGYVPQEHMLFKGTVEENLKVGLADAHETNQTWAIQVAAFENDLQYMSDGLMTEVGERGAGLSGGQKQRLSIARAIIKDPQILILDDSLSAVDAKTEQEIVKNIKDSRQGKTNIIVTHRFSVVREAHRIYVVENGQITDVGTHYELLNRDGWYKKQYENQVKGKDGRI